MGACSRDMNCGGVSQPCLAKGEKIYSTCPNPPAAELNYNDVCETMAFYQKSK